MEQQRLLSNLEIARQHVRDGDVQILRQRQLISLLSAAGDDTTAAEQALQVLEEMQDIHLLHVKWFTEALDKLAPA